MKCFRLFLWRKKMRTIIVVIYVFLFLILGLPVLGIEWIIAKFDKHAADISQLRIVQWGLRCVSFLAGVHLTVEGKEHVPTDQAVLYIGNHRSIFDIVITYAQCPNLTGYISKDGVNKVPLLGIWMRRLYCLFLDRKDLKQGLNETADWRLSQIAAGFPGFTVTRRGCSVGGRRRRKPGHHDSDSKWQNFELFAAGIAEDFRESADACDFYLSDESTCK